ncbi:hypothetical protein E2C01_093095 [Portunus trituberculatus]|uniref:Uncharacterized protein n=1 Tax=Portunus trituberculatus TaxID=210409 RepID=A0A5B7JZM6_PORTR|nr:hypothetical protein [Portunus trituberculatus]
MIFNTTVSQSMCGEPLFACKSFITLLTHKLAPSSVDRAACLEVIAATMPMPPHS